MQTRNFGRDSDGYQVVSGAEAEVLSAAEEKSLLTQLCGCRDKLASALAKIPCVQLEASDSPLTIAQYITAINAGRLKHQARLGAVFQRYNEIRMRLAFANMRLVAHIAGRYRNRGVSYADLLQDGFCGLLEAIDRFDPAHDNKLATYATWWIRQAVQKSVAEGAYPVRLSPRHLRQLARNQDEPPAGAGKDGSAAVEEPRAHEVFAETIRKIVAATRPVVSLDAGIRADTEFCLLDAMGDHSRDSVDAVDVKEIVSKLIGELNPREQQVLTLRFGLEDKARHSLSEVGKALCVSKERVRQIQERALSRMRELADEAHLAAALDFDD